MELNGTAHGYSAIEPGLNPVEIWQFFHFVSLDIPHYRLAVY